MTCPKPAVTELLPPTQHQTSLQLRRYQSVGSASRPSNLRESVPWASIKHPPQKRLVLVNPLPHSQDTQQWDGGGSGLGRKGGLAKPSKGHGPVSVPKGGARQRGHPVPLREGGEQAPLSPLSCHPSWPNPKGKMKEGLGGTSPSHPPGSLPQL